MTDTKEDIKIYHIYAKDKCLMHSVKEEEFEITWKTLKNMVGIMKTDYNIDDLTYEELSIKKEFKDASY